MMNTRKISIKYKIYHKPSLTEWGNLQETTKGAAGANLDMATFNASPLSGRPVPNNLNPLTPPIKKP